MRITQVDVTPITMPKEDKEWRFALAATADTQGCLVQIQTDEGIEGVGYTGCAAHYGATQPVVMSALDLFQQNLVGLDPLALAARLDDLDHWLEGNNFAKAGIDLALHDLMAKALRVPLYQLLSGMFRTDIPMIRIVPIKAPDAMAAVSERLVADGYRYLKIKVEGDIEEDVRRIKAIRERVGPEIHLTIDANQSYTPKDAIRSIRRMEPYAIDLVEQPVHAEDFEGLGQVTRAVDVVVEADESAQSLDHVFRLASDRLVDSVSLKVPKLGGLRRTQEAAAICRAAHVTCRLGAAVGSRLLAAACMHLAAATPNMGYACELGEFARLYDDPAEGLEVDNGVLRVPTGIGVGVTLRQPVPASRGRLPEIPR